MGQTLVRLEKAQETIIKNLRENGYFRTKSEAIRAGIMEIGRHYNIVAVHDDMVVKQVTDPGELKVLRKISEEIRQGKRKVYSQEEVDRKYGFKPEQL